MTSWSSNSVTNRAIEQLCREDPGWTVSLADADKTYWNVRHSSCQSRIGGFHTIGNVWLDNGTYLGPTGPEIISGLTERLAAKLLKPERSRDAAAAQGRRRREAPTRKPQHPFPELAVTAIATVARAQRDLEQSAGRKYSRKPLREACWFWWTDPFYALTPRYRKYPLTVPWSPAAIELLNTGMLIQGLVVEHVRPVTGVLDELILCADDPTAVHRLLDAEMLTVITTTDNALINKAGFARTVPASGDPWDRYRLAGLDPLTFTVPHGPTG
jgi:hypothetical protein